MSDAKEKAPSDKIIKYRERYPVNLITVVFGLILLYLLVEGVLLLTRNRVRAYNIGSAVSDRTVGSYTGVILREETVVRAEREGYVTYYAVEGQRLSGGSVSCMISDSRDFENLLHRLMYSQEVLSGTEQRRIREKVSESMNKVDLLDIGTAREAKAAIQSTVFHSLLADGGEEFLSTIPADSYEIYRTPRGGYFITELDGLEGKSAEELTSGDLLPDSGERVLRKYGDTLKTGDFLYKLADDDKFTLLFPLTAEEREGLLSEKSLTIRTSDGVEMTGSFSLSRTVDGQFMGVLGFSKYGGNFVDRRYLDFEILDQEVTGFKIPLSSLVTKSFFVVPEEYIVTGGLKNRQKGILLQNGEEASFYPVTVYFRDESDPDGNFVIGEGNVYIYDSALSAGMKLIAPLSSENTEVRETTLTITAAVSGVYQINNGYCIFKPVVELENSVETSYVIIRSDTPGGLRAYDRILLDAGEMKENQIIFE